MASSKTYYVYMMASRKDGTLYIGVTNDLIRRAWQHRNDVHEGFTQKYGVHRLVWYEATSDIYVAVQTEKRMKNWKREWKIRRIEEKNPDWEDLFEALTSDEERGFRPAPE